MRHQLTVKFFIAFAAMMISTASRAAEFKCDGAACKDIKLSYSSGCHQAQNTGSRKVKVQRGAFSKVLKPGETWQTRNLDGSCIQIIIGSTTAEYAD
jgi:hypothetical protein